MGYDEEERSNSNISPFDAKRKKTVNALGNINSSKHDEYATFANDNANTLNEGGTEKKIAEIEIPEGNISDKDKNSYEILEDSYDVVSYEVDFGSEKDDAVRNEVTPRSP